MANYGAITNLVSGTAALSRPSGAHFMFILNQDTAPLQLVFSNNGNTLGQISLSAASATGAPGGYIDSIGFPLLANADTVTLTSTVTTGQFGSGFSTSVPNNTATYS